MAGFGNLELSFFFCLLLGAIHGLTAQGAHQDTCMTRALLKARVHPTAIQRLAKTMVRQSLDEEIMASLEYSAAEPALKNAGVISWVNRRKIFQCFNSRQQIKLNRSCASSICQNGGVCSLDVEAQTHFCQCAVNYHGKFCKTRISENEKLILLETEMAQLRAALNNVGTSYTRWGHDACPSTATLIYEGFLAGSSHDSKGNGANQLCLPFDPQFVPNIGTASGAWIYGAEYRGVNSINSRNQVVQDRNIPCAVCRVQIRSMAIMVPARNDCPQNWTREYYGFLMAGHKSSSQRDYICVDREMRTLPGHAAGDAINTLRSVGVDCSKGFDCPPYQQNKPLTCTVCTK